jgi:signal transduction histidine kinase
VRDITERKRLEKRLLQSERLATIGKMAARIAHEIRNPLSSISLNAELLEEEVQAFQSENSTEAKGLIRAISEEVDRLTQLTEEYLQFSRLPRSQFAAASVNEVLEDLLDFMAPEIQKRNIKIEKNLAENLPEMYLDRAQLRQALLNIVRNALEAMRHGGVLGVRTRLLDKRTIEIAISDTGEGIPPENVSKIFDPFYTTKDVGTGLGLPMSQQIVTDHHGTLVCQSRPGEGTTFFITLPVQSNQGERSFG